MLWRACANGFCAELGTAAGGAAGADEDDEEERPVAVAARSALSLLRSALEAGDRFFRGQSLAQFRAAASHPAAAIPLGGSCLPCSMCPGLGRVVRAAPIL